METRIGINKEHLQAITLELSIMLADAVVLQTKTRNAHWNVEGSDFFSKHTFFEMQYKQLDELADELAERIRSLGHYAPATLKNFLSLTRLTEQNRRDNTSLGFIQDLLSDHESIIDHLREKINRMANGYHDIGTSDLITSHLEIHEKMAWMLRSHIK